MKLCTASETLSFIREMEEQQAKFYEGLAGRFPEKTEFFEGLAKENRKFNKQIQMAYQSVITDAIEGCYAFDIEADDFQLNTDLADGASLAQAAAKALETEKVVVDCYQTGADQSASLLADVPRNFKIVIKKRGKRLDELKSMT